MTGAFRLYLRLIASSAMPQRILLINGPAVLGRAHWRALHAERVAADIMDMLDILMARGIVQTRPTRPTRPLESLLLAALNDAALSTAHATDPEAASLAAGDAFVFLLDGMRCLR